MSSTTARTEAMILYSLLCAKNHGFDAWFPNSDAFDRQAKRGIVVCPRCGSTKVRKAIMAPRISKGGTKGSKRQLVAQEPAAVAAQAVTPAPAPSEATNVMSPEIRQVLTELRKQVENNCDYVGDQFAEEARKIHYGESKKRGIYGESTEEEAEALKEEGIEFGRVPWVPRTN
jgi:hypothetical protein